MPIGPPNIGQTLTTFHTGQPEGVWAIVDRDNGETITMVYATELDALRALNGRGYGRVCYVPFGKDLHDLDVEETRMKELRAQVSSGATPSGSSIGGAS